MFAVDGPLNVVVEVHGVLDPDTTVAGLQAAAFDETVSTVKVND